MFDVLKTTDGKESRVRPYLPEGELLGYVGSFELVWDSGKVSTKWAAWRPNGKPCLWYGHSVDFVYASDAERHLRYLARRVAQLQAGKSRIAQRRARLGRVAPKRDSQRSKLYRAESIAFTGYPEAKGRSLVQVRALAAVYAKQLGLAAPPIYLKSGARSHYNPSHGCIKLSASRGATLDWVLTHELSHYWDNPTGTAKPWHGREFAACHLDVVTRVLGRTWGEKLRAAYTQLGVKFRAPRKRELSEEQRAVLRERLAKARAAKQARGNA